MKISNFDFDKIGKSIEFNGNSMEIEFFVTDIEKCFFDEEGELLFYDADLLLQVFDEYVIKILNQIGLTDEYLRDQYRLGKYSLEGESATFLIEFEIEYLELAEVTDNSQLSFFD